MSRSPSALSTAAAAAGRWGLRVLLLAGLALTPGGRVHAGGTVTNATYEALSAALIGGGLVRFECDGTISLPQPLLITVSTVFDASGRAIVISSSSTNSDPLFVVAPTVPLGLNSLTLSGGRGAFGGAILNSNGTVWATACLFTGNTATGATGADGAAGANEPGIGRRGGDGGPGKPGQGGAIYSTADGAVFLTNCIFSANSAVGGSGGTGGAGGTGELRGGDGGQGGAAGAANGGAVFNAGTLIAINCTFGTNSVAGGDGGAGGASGSGTTGIGAAAVGDGADGGAAGGGAIYNTGTVRVTGSTFYNNTITGGAGAVGGSDGGGEGRAGAAGGAAAGGAFVNTGTATLINCTVYLNQVTGGTAGDGGGGDWIGGRGGDGGDARGGGFLNLGTAGITNCTFAANTLIVGTAGAGGAAVAEGRPGHAGNLGGADVEADNAPLTLRNCILAGTTNLANAYGSVVDGGHNLSSDATPPLSAPGLNNQDPKLGTFGSNGGPTQTLPLAPGSPAVGLAAPEPGVTTDQRGVTRPADKPDAGAYERQTVLIGGVVSSQGTPAVLNVNLVSPSTTNRTTTDASGYFVFADALPGPYQVRLDPGQIAPFWPPQYNFYLTELSEGQTNLNFYARAASLTITNLTGLPARMQLTGVGVPQLNYVIQAATALNGSGATWTSLVTNAAGTTGRFTFTDTNVNLFSRRYYRAVLP